MPHPLFEPVPQRLEVFTRRTDFGRNAPWTEWLRSIGAEVVKRDAWPNGEVFVLSESTLLTDQHRFVLLTCGNAQPLGLLNVIPEAELTGWRWSRFNPLHSHQTDLSENILQRWKPKGLKTFCTEGYDSCGWGIRDSSLTCEFNFSGIRDPVAFTEILGPQQSGLISLVNEFGLGFLPASHQSTQQIFEFKPQGLTLHFVDLEKQIFVHWSPECEHLNVEVRIASPARSSWNALQFAEDLRNRVRAREVGIAQIHDESVSFQFANELAD